MNGRVNTIRLRDQVQYHLLRNTYDSDSRVHTWALLLNPFTCDLQLAPNRNRPPSLLYDLRFRQFALRLDRNSLSTQRVFTTSRNFSQIIKLFSGFETPTQ